MAALLGIELEAAQEACKEAAQGEVVTVANDNGGGQVVVSGHKAAVERCHRDGQAARRQARHAAAGERAVPLSADAARRRCHAGGAGDGDARARRACRWSPMCWPAEITEPDAIKQRLVEQVTGLVRWRESVQYMKSQGVEALVECGSGKVLSGLVKRIDKEMTGLALNTPADIEAFLKTAVVSPERLRRNEADVRSFRQGRAGDRRLGRHRRRDRPRAAQAGRHGDAVGHARRGAGEAQGASSASARTWSPRAWTMPPTSTAWSRTPRRRWARSTSWSTTPASRATTSRMRMKDEEWEKVLQVNLTGTFRLTRAAMRGMMRRRFGRVDQHHLDRGRHRQSRPGQLCRRQGRPDRHVEVAGPGARLARHHRELRGAGLHRHADDRRADRRAEEGHPRPRARPTGWARPTRSRPAWSIWPATRPPTSPGRPCTSTAGWR